MPEKHFLNAIYKDIMNPGNKTFGYNTVPGLGKQVKVTGMVQNTQQGKAIFVSNMEVQKAGS